MLACLALWQCWRKPAVLGLGIVAVLCAALSYSVDVSRLLEGLPLLQGLQWTRALLVLDFALAILAGIGLQVLLDRYRHRAARIGWWGSTLGVSILLALLWLNHRRTQMSPTDARIQGTSFKWAGAQLGVLILIGAGLSLVNWSRGDLDRRLRFQVSIGAALVGVQAVFLLTATPSLWASANSSFPETAAEARLIATVGQARVGFKTCPSTLDVPSLGILSESNDAYGLSEVSVFDPVVPTSYFDSYYAAIGQAVGDTGKGGFCPSLTTAALAATFRRRFHIGPSGLGTAERYYLQRDPP